MAGLWDILVPSAATNYVKNPSFEASALTSWTTTTTGAGSSAEAFDNEFVISGIQSYRLTTIGTITTTTYQDITLSAGSTYRLSVYVRLNSMNAQPPSLIAYDGGGTSNPVTDAHSGTIGQWERLEVTKVCPGGGSIRFAIVAANPDDVAYDCAQLELGSTATTYFDGDTEGCTWTGTRYTSASTRPATARNSGVWTDLQTYSAYITSVLGLGIGDNAITMAEYAIRDGGEVRQVRIPSRPFTLGFTITASTQATLHTYRQTLENLFRAGRFGGINPVYLRYRGAAENIVIKAIYEGGMSYVQVGQDGYAENVAARFVLEDAMLEREEQGIKSLDYSRPILASAFNILQYNGSYWTTAGSGFNAGVYGLVEDYSGTIFVGGAFTDTGGGEAFNYIAQFDGDTWAAVAGGTNGTVNELFISSSGDLYAGGEFTTAGGVTVNRIAKYNGDTWSALDGGVNNSVYTIKMDSAGVLYVGGELTEAGSTPVTVGKLAKFDGDTWSAVPAGDTGADAYINMLEFDASGTLYACGAFSTIGGVSASKIAKFDGTSWSAMGSGFNNVVNAIMAAPDGYLYAGGSFTDTGGGEAINSFARWNGTSWEAVSEESLYIVYSLAYKNGTVYIGSEGTASGTPFVEWNGATRYIRNLNIPAAGQTVNVVTPSKLSDRLWIGGTLSDTTSTAAEVNTVTINGTGDTQPKLTIIGAGTTTVHWLENQTTGQIIYFDMDVLAGERIELDFSKGSIASSYGRNVASGILNNSDFSTFKLVSGTNTIAAFAVSTGSAKMILTWTEKEIGL